MNKIIEEAKHLKAALLEEPLIQEYLRVKNIFENSKELKLKRDEIALAKSNNSSDYLTLKKEYENHPLVVNYYTLKGEVYDLLKEIENELGL